MRSSDSIRCGRPSSTRSRAGDPGRPLCTGGASLGAARPARARPSGGARVLRLGRDPGGRRPGRGWHLEVPEARDAVREPARGLHPPLSGLERAAARPAAPALPCAAARDPRRPQPGRRRLPGLGRRPGRRGQRAARAGALGGDARPLPERVLQAIGRPLPGCRALVVGGAAERRGRRAVHAAGGAAGGRAGAAARGRPDAGVPPRAGPAHARGGPATHPGAELVVTGRVTAPLEPLAAELGVAGRVTATGRYAQRDAPALYRAAHLLLHTKVNDPCPNVVLEALASGLPVVYPASGGTVELVGPDAGIGVPHPDGFERDEPPGPAELAAAVVAALASRERLAEAARRRAVERFPLDAWLDRHTALFEELVARARRPAR